MKRKLILFCTFSLIFSILLLPTLAHTHLHAHEGTSKCSTIPTDAVTLEKAQVVAIDYADCTLTVIPEGKSNMINNQIILRITPETVIQNKSNKRIYKLSDLEPGIYIKAVHSPMMTKSIPPQTVAFTITIL